MIERTEESLAIRLSSRLTDYVELYRSNMEYGVYELVDEKVLFSGRIRDYVDEGLNTDTIYYYKMKACNNNGCSELSEVTGAGTTEVVGPIEIPPTPTGVEVEEVEIELGTNDARLSWVAAPRATYYKVYQDSSFETEVSAPLTSYYDADPNSFLFSLTRTIYTVSACNKAGCSMPSDSVVVFRPIVIE